MSNVSGFSAESAQAANAFVGVLIAAIAAVRQPTLRELALQLSIDLEPDRLAELSIELGEDDRGRLVWDLASPKQDLLVAFGVARFLALLGARIHVSELAAAMLSQCHTREFPNQAS